MPDTYRISAERGIVLKKIDLYILGVVLFNLILLSAALFLTEEMNSDKAVFFAAISAVLTFLIFAVLRKTGFIQVFPDLKKELKVRKNKFFKIIDRLKEPIIVVDRNLRINIVNRSFERLYSLRGIRKQHLNEVLGDNRLTRLIRDQIKTGKIDRVEIEKDEKVFLCSMSIVHETGELALVMHDITERKQLEEMKKEFVSNMSHELRTPLTSIKGFVETLEGKIDDDTGKRYLKIVNRNTERLIKIVRDLLMLSELENVEYIEKSPVDLNDLLKDVSEMFIKKAAQKRLGIIIELPPDLIVPGDEYRLEQIFINLIENAIKYSEADELKIEGQRNGDNIIITVSDNGIGIREDKLERLFERFFRVDKGRSRDMGGTGLGLSIVKHAVSLHDGTITESSDKGKGTTLDLVFPI